MKRPITSRADLLRAFATNDPTLTTAMAELLGYERTNPRQEQEDADSPPQLPQRDSRDSTDSTTTYQPEPVPFWRLETFDAVAPVELPSVPVRATPGDGKWRGRPTTLPDFAPLASKQAVLTELRRVPATRRTTNDIDVDAVVERVSQGRLLNQLPYRQRRAWGSAITIIEDRARRLVPYWRDQEYVINILKTLYPPSGMTIARIGDGDSQPVIRWPEEQRGQAVSPVPGTIVLVLGDLDCLAHHGEQLQQVWLQFGQSLRERHIPAVALVPAKMTDVSPELTRTWTIARWGTTSGTGAESSSHSQADALEQLLTLVSPAVRIEPGLLRAVRGVFPEGRIDPGLEAQLWQHSAITSQHSVAASWDAKQREVYLERFAEQEESLRQSVLNLIRTWRAPLYHGVWFEEIDELDEQSQQLVDLADREDAAIFWTMFAEEQAQRDQRDVGTDAWISRVADRWPTAGHHNPRVQQALHRLYDLVRPRGVETQVPGWYQRSFRPQQSLFGESHCGRSQTNYL